MEALERFKKIINYDFKNETFEKNVGNEARTFHISNRSKPLLSISRILKPLIEHKYWVIPKLNMLPNRLVGSLSHRLLEKSFYTNDIVLIKENIEEVKELLGKDWDNFIKLKPEKQTEILKSVNVVVKTTFSILKQKNIKIIASEKYICNQDFHGYIDLVGIKDGDIPVILELKTSSLDQAKYETNLQLGLYKHLINVEEVETYAIRFNLKKKLAHFDSVDPTDFMIIKNLYERIK